MITSRNEEWGYFGTIQANSDGKITDREATIIFDSMVRHLDRRFDCGLDVARDYLDSQCGRHLADATMDAQGNVATELPRWIKRDFDRFLREYNAEQFASTVS